MASVLGVRINGDFGVLHPELSVAWHHEFGDTRQSVKHSFADAPGDVTFKVISAKTARDSALVGAGAKFIINPEHDIIVRYDGLFNQDYTSHGIMARWTSRF